MLLYPYPNPVKSPIGKTPVLPLLFFSDLTLRFSLIVLLLSFLLTLNGFASVSAARCPPSTQRNSVLGARPVESYSSIAPSHVRNRKICTVDVCPGYEGTAIPVKFDSLLGISLQAVLGEQSHLYEGEVCGPPNPEIAGTGRGAGSPPELFRSLCLGANLEIRFSVSPPNPKETIMA